LLSAYRLIPGAHTCSARLLPIEMMRPPSPMCAAAALEATKAARRLTATISSKSARVRASPVLKMPALLTRMSSRPKAWTAAATAASMASGAVLSAAMAKARRPRTSMPAATAGACSAARA
jgi:hypothetical protein